MFQTFIDLVYQIILTKLNQQLFAWMRTYTHLLAHGKQNSSWANKTHKTFIHWAYIKWFCQLPEQFSTSCSSQSFSEHWLSNKVYTAIIMAWTKAECREQQSLILSKERLTFWLKNPKCHKGKLQRLSLIAKSMTAECESLSLAFEQCLVFIDQHDGQTYSWFLAEVFVTTTTKETSPPHPPTPSICILSFLSIL